MPSIVKLNVDSMDKRCLDHFLEWMELGTVAKASMREKRVIREWRFHWFDDEELKRRNALRSWWLCSVC